MPKPIRVGRLGATSLLVSIAIVATPAAANPLPGAIGVTGTDDMVPCQMNAKRCLDPITDCQLAKVQAEATTPGECAAILGALQEQETGTAFNVSVLGPDGVHDRPVYKTPVNLGAMYFMGLDNGYAGETFHQALHNFLGIYATYLQRLGWRLNGAHIDTCQEYAYEKYFALSLFEDETSGYIKYADYQALYDNAYVNGLSPIGANGMAGYPLAGFDDTVFGSLVVAGDTLKNEYARTPIHGKDLGGNVFIHEAADGEEKVLSIPGRLDVWLAYLPRPTSVAGMVFLNTEEEIELRTALLGARSAYPSKGWQWHHDMASSNGALSEAARVDIAEEADVFLALLARRAEIAGALGRRVQPIQEQPIVNEVDPGIPEVPGSQVINPAFDQQIAGPLLDEGWLFGDGITYQVVGGVATPMANVIGPMNNQQPPGPPVDIDMPNHVTTDGVSVADGVLGGVLGTVAPDQPLVKAPTGVFDGGACGAACLAYQLAWVDIQIQAKLVQARDRGCLDPSNTTCDWLPRTFGRALAEGTFRYVKPDAPYQGSLQVADSFTTRREHDLATCTEFVGGTEIKPRQFAPLKDTTSNPEKEWFAGCGAAPTWEVDCTASPTALEQCQQCYADQYAAVETLAGQLVDPKTNKLRLGESAGDYVLQGGDMFGLEFGYGITYEMTGILAGQTNAQTVGVTTTLSARVFDHSFQLLELAIHGGVGPEAGAPTGSLGILGAPVPITDVPFHIAQHPAVNQEIFGASQTFFVGPIPVTVKGGVAGRVGVDYQLVSGQVAGGTGLEATVKPYAAVNAYASAALGMKFASAGIRGRLVLAELGMPTHAGGVIRQEANGRKLDLGLSSDLSYNFLSGQLTSFVEISPPWPLPDWDRETVLTSWDGYTRTQPLFARNVANVPLEILSQVAAMACAKTPGCQP